MTDTIATDETVALISKSVTVTENSSYGSYALFGIAVTGMGYYIATLKGKKEENDYVRV